MPDINWGGDSSTAPFSSRLDEANGDLILAEDNSGGTVLLEYDGTTWQYRGPVELNGEDISGVGTLTATDVTVSGTVDAGAVNTGEINNVVELRDSDDPKQKIESANSSIVEVAPGASFNISETILIPNNCEIRGARAGTTFSKAFDGLMFEYDSHVALRRLFLDGNKANHSGDVIAPVDRGTTATPGLKMFDLKVFDAAGTNLAMSGDYFAHLGRSEIRGAGGDNVVIEDATVNTADEASQITFGQRTTIGGAAGSNIRVNAPNGHGIFINSTVTDAGEAGVRVDAVNNKLGVGPEANIVNNSGPAVYVNTGNRVDNIGVQARIKNNGASPTLPSDPDVGQIHVEGAGTELRPLMLGPNAIITDPPTGINDGVRLANSEDNSVVASGSQISFAHDRSINADSGNSSMVAFGSELNTQKSDTITMFAINPANQITRMRRLGAESDYYWGERTSDPHAANGSGDIYIDYSANPPVWRVDDPADSAWEAM